MSSPDIKLEPKHLLEKGYFFDELPPPFNTFDLGRKYNQIDRELKLKLNTILGVQKRKSSYVVRYSAPRNEVSRRIFGIPNPLHFILLTKSIFKYRKSIFRVLKKSKYSIFLNKELKSNWDKFEKERFVSSGENIFELKTDISRYFPSIYTHSIPWAIYGKTKAKQEKNNKKLWGNVIDKNIRNLQDGQSVGIPIGPNVSRILAEIISSEVDDRIRKFILKEKIDARGFRYIDDYFFYFPDEITGEKLLKMIRDSLENFNLELSKEKTRIIRFPFGLVSEWVIVLRSFRFRGKKAEQENDIKNFLSIALNFSKQYTDKSTPILKYALIRLQSIKIHSESWLYFESWLLKIILYNAAIIPEVFRIFLLNKKWLNTVKIKTTLEKLIELNVNKRNNYETAWGLWMAKAFQIKIKSMTIAEVLRSDDSASILIALDLIETGLATKNFSKEIKKLSTNLTKDSLYGDMWLLVYEGTKRGWINPPTNPIKNDEFFSILENNDVSFYNRNRQITKKHIKTKGWANRHIKSDLPLY